MNFNPIQMGADFTSWYMSDIEILVRGMVDMIQFRYGGEEVPLYVLEQEMENYGINYEDLPQSCKDMIDELEVA